MRRAAFGLLCLLPLLTLLVVVMGGCGTSATSTTSTTGNGENDGAKSSGAKSGAKSETKETSTLELVRLSEKTTVEFGSASFVMDMSFPGGEGMPETNMQMSGVQDFASGDGQFDMVMPVLPIPGGIENRVVDGYMYQRYPEEMRSQMGFMPSGKEWISTNLEEQYEEQFGMNLSDMQNAGSEMPADQLQYLRSVGSVDEVGSEKLDGVKTTHYRASVDLDRELQSLEGGREVTEYYRDLEKQLGTGELPVDVWLDDRGRVRKQVMVIPMPDTAPVEGIDGETTQQQLPEGDLTISMSFSDFGVPVDVEVPDPETVITQEEFMSLTRQAGAA